MLKKIAKAFINGLEVKLKWSSLSNGVYVFNYHRIGDALTSPFDPNVYSCTEEVFAKHLAFYAQEFEVISVDELASIYLQQNAIDKKYAIITFDDGYVDNFSAAFKRLKEFNLPAAFFIPTDYIDHPNIPWWDEIAWLIRNTKKLSIQLKSSDEPIELGHGDIVHKIRRVLRVIKADSKRSMNDKLIELSSACEVSMPEELRQCQLFLNWQQIKEMRACGMHIGSHSVSHNILAHLTPDNQKNELVESKVRLEEILGEPVISIAYPVGGKSAFSELTMQLAEESGYQLGFSFINGVITKLNKSSKYQLRRLPVDDNCTISQLKQIIVKSPLA